MMSGKDKIYDILIIGGGPAGATAAIYLTSFGFNVCLIERNTFPRDVLCGEFLSGEVSSILKHVNLFDKFLLLNPNKINSFRFINSEEKELLTSFDFPAYSIKRSIFDNFLLNNARLNGAQIFQRSEVKSVKREVAHYNLLVKKFDDNLNFEFIIIKAKFVIAAYGKKSLLDNLLRRDFIKYKSHLSGIKFHLNKKLLKPFNESELRMYSFPGLYCGINKVNNDDVTFCFLYNRRMNNGKSKPLIDLISQELIKDLFYLKNEQEVLNNPKFGTGNIYFGRKSLAENGIFMIGDAAGMAAPLIGDGIAMAMQSAVLISNIINEALKKKEDKIQTENIYQSAWNRMFNGRIIVSLLIQKGIFYKKINSLGVNILSNFPESLKYIIYKSRGI